MSTYTTQLRYICEQLTGRTESAPASETAAVIRNALPKIFDFDFPIFDAKYRSVLETKIIKHYYLREIGAETVGQFKFYLDMTLNEIMPFYNKLYETANIKFDIFHDVDYYRDHKGSGSSTKDTTGGRTVQTSENVIGNSSGTIETETSGETSGSSSTESTVEKNHLDKYSDTPQGGITGLDSDTYLTNARIIADDDHEESGTTTGSTDSGTSTTGTASETSQETSGETTETSTDNEQASTTDEYLDHVYGKMGTASYADLILKYRETLLDIDRMIIDELNVCFMNIY